MPSPADDVTCSITFEVMRNPVLASDGFMYEEAAIKEHFERNGADARSPQTNLPLTNRELTPCPEVAAVCRAWRKHLEEHPDASDAAGATAAHAGAPMAATFAPPTIDSPLFAKIEETQQHLTALGVDKIKRQEALVIGHQGVGKSTMLERLLGHAVFPRHANRNSQPCTKMVVSVITTRGPWCAPTLRIVAAADAAVVSGSSSGPAWRGVPLGFPLDRLPDVVRDIMDQLAGDAGFVTDRVLQVSLQAPHLPQLVFVDVPGLPGNDVPGAADAKALIVSTVQLHKASAMFLWVCDALSHEANSSVGALIRDCKIEHQTTGVLVQTDRLMPGSDDETRPEALLKAVDSRRTGPIRIGGGWFAVSNRSGLKAAQQMMTAAGGVGCLEHYRLLGMRDSEAKWKQSLIDEATPTEKMHVMAIVGDERLRQHMQDGTQRYCKDVWVPEMRATAIAQLEAATAHLVRIGLPMTRPATGNERSHRIDVSTMIDGQPRSWISVIDGRMPTIVRQFWTKTPCNCEDSIVDRVEKRMRLALEKLQLTDVPAIAAGSQALARVLADLLRDMQQVYERDAHAAVARKKLEFEQRLRQATDDFCGSLLQGFDHGRSAEEEMKATTASMIMDVVKQIDDAKDRAAMTVVDLELEVTTPADAPFALGRFHKLVNALQGQIGKEIQNRAPAFAEQVAADRARMTTQAFEVVPSDDASHLVIRPKDASALAVDRFHSDFVYGNFLVHVLTAVEAATSKLGVDVTQLPELLAENEEPRRMACVADAHRLCKVLRVLDATDASF